MKSESKGVLLRKRMFGFLVFDTETHRQHDTVTTKISPKILIKSTDFILSCNKEF